jgi:hypothetical protein
MPTTEALRNAMNARFTEMMDAIAAFQASRDALAVAVTQGKEAEIVLDKRSEKGVTEYWVKWKGLPLSRCTWVSEDKLEVAQGLIEEFESTLKNKQLGKRKRSGKKDDSTQEEGKKVKAK